MVNWKGYERKRSGPNFTVLSRNSPGGTEKNHENLSQDRSPGQDLIPEPPEYEAGVLNNRHRRLVQRRGKNLSWHIIWCYVGIVETSYITCNESNNLLAAFAMLWWLFYDEHTVILVALTSYQLGLYLAFLWIWHSFREVYPNTGWIKPRVFNHHDELTTWRCHTPKRHQMWLLRILNGSCARRAPFDVAQTHVTNIPYTSCVIYKRC
jgi:hypothetical protein